MKNKLVFMDVESDGLYGAFLTVAFIVTNWDGQELARAYYGIKRENMQVTVPWVKDNVIPKLGEYEAVTDEKELLKRAWNFWLEYREEAYMVCEVGYPVEARFLRACVALDEATNMWLAPFPLIDLESILLAKGYEPLTERSRILSNYKEEAVHNALYDVEAEVQLWKELMRKEGASWRPI